MADIKPKFEVPKFDIPTVEVPKIMRELAEKSVVQAKDAYAKFKSAAEETTDMLEDTYTMATKGASEFNLKALEALRVNVNSAFDYTSQLLASKNLAEAVELSSSHVRKQFETLSAQAKDLATIAQKVATKTSEPIKTGVSKFKMQ
jgi:phasin